MADMGEVALASVNQATSKVADEDALRASRLEEAANYMRGLSELQRFRDMMKRSPGSPVHLRIGNGVVGIGGCLEVELNDVTSVLAAIEVEEKSNLEELRRSGITFGDWS